jgi:hypothetical protein
MVTGTPCQTTGPVQQVRAGKPCQEPLSGKEPAERHPFWRDMGGDVWFNGITSPSSMSWRI